jgi:anhydro-N-acetylmuramic acid kinase
MNNVYDCIGVMSGTSLDGVDIIYCTLHSSEGAYSYTILESKTYSYSKEWMDALQSAFEKTESELEDLDILYGTYLGTLISTFIEENNIDKLDFIASHGHTIFHKPAAGYTLQIGCGKQISKITNTKVIYDFRTQDVALGGQGAPLVPVGDALLFPEFDYCLNLGGFANVSYDESGIRKAFDVCPVNIVMNYYMQQIGKEFDDKGQLAASGNINTKLLKELNSDAFYELAHPKSLGFEFVKQHVFPLIDSYKINIEDILRTFVEHTAIQISKVLSQKENSKTLVTGGGVYNDFLMQRIKTLSITEIRFPSKKLVEFKEALLFAFLGILRIEGKNNCLKSVTGASKNHSSGKISIPNSNR